MVRGCWQKKGSHRFFSLCLELLLFFSFVACLSRLQVSLPRTRKKKGATSGRRRPHAKKKIGKKPRFAGKRRRKMPFLCTSLLQPSSCGGFAGRGEVRGGLQIPLSETPSFPIHFFLPNFPPASDQYFISLMRADFHTDALFLPPPPLSPQSQGKL